MDAIGTHAIGELPPSTALAHVNPSGLSDVPTINDEIGFRPYVRAIAWFLSNEETKPPLTMSIEGPWGSGKSSFMLQLEEELRSQNKEKSDHYYVRFNAWRSDKDEALWAAFVLEFIEQLERNFKWYKRACISVRLFFRRVDWRRGWLQLARIALYLIVLVATTVYAFRNPAIADLTKAALLVAPWLVAIHFGLEKATAILGNPLTYDLSKYVRDLGYRERVAFIDRFQRDFSDVVQNYAGPTGRIFVFIDDLDRCEVPHAADLLQAINLLLSVDQGNLFFILGLDREMVAAGIAAKNEKILPYIAAGSDPNGSDKPDVEVIGLRYGYSFMEKFIQIPFRIPRPDEREIAKWVASLTGVDSGPPGPGATQSAPSLDMRKGYDPAEFEEVVESVARLFQFNPRRLKQFVNLFRVRLMIALSTGVLTPADGSGDGPLPVDTITIQRLGLLTASDGTSLSGSSASSSPVSGSTRPSGPVGSPSTGTTTGSFGPTGPSASSPVSSSFSNVSSRPVQSSTARNRGTTSPST